MIKRDLAKVTYVDGVDYCDLCGYVIGNTDRCSHPCAFENARIAAALQREPLVQEVIRLFLKPEAWWTNPGKPELAEALRKLAEWKP